MASNLVPLSVFVIAYLLFIFLPHQRTYVAVGGSILLVIFGSLSINGAFFAINWNVMGIFVGMLAVTDVFMVSRVPAYVAEIIVDRSKNIAWAVLMICLLTGFISAFVENVATVLIIAPIAMSLAKKLKLNPMNMMIAIAVSSNLQGTATLIGDPPSMLLGGFAKMNFMDFFFYQGRPSIFFAVELGALASFIVLYFIFNHEKNKIKLIPVEKIRHWSPTIMLVGLILLLALSSFIDPGSSYAAGILCMVFGITALIWDRLVNKNDIIAGIKKLDWESTFFLAGVFVLVGAIISSGWIEVLSNSLSGMVGSDILAGFILIVGFSVVVSTFVDNVPYLAAMLPVAISMSAKIGINPSLYLFGLLIGASLGGNITPIGASANIVACSILKKEGHTVGFFDFLKIGLPFTLAAVTAASAFIWFVWR